MKRDLDLYRDILLIVETWPPNHRRQPIRLEAWDQEVIDRHIQLLEEEGFLVASFLDLPEDGYLKKAEVQRMTAAGHDFLDSIRDEGIWRRVQGKLGAVGGTASLEVIKALAVASGKGALGLD